MKRKLLFTFLAILAAALFFAGCPAEESNGKKPEVGFESLAPLTPAPIPEPSGYKAFPEGVPKDEDGNGGSGLLGNTAFYVTSGGEGFIEKGSVSGSYEVTIVTKPGGLSAVYFQDSEYVYKTGFYLSLNLPAASAASPHKPIGMIAFAAAGPQESGENDWGSAQRVNMTGDNKVEQTDKYLSGRVDFAWENSANVNPRKTIVLYIYWHEDEEAGAEYTFAARKILVSNDDDLDPPGYPKTAWTPEAVAEPTTGWKDFPSANILAANAINGGGAIAGGFTAAAGGGYTGTVAVTPGGFSRIQIPGSPDNSAFVKGYYFSLELPASSVEALHPIKVIPVATKDLSGGALWASEQQIVPIPPTNRYVAGNVGIQWYSEENATSVNSFFFDFYWHAQEPAGGTYTFTLKKLKITE